MKCSGLSLAMRRGCSSGSGKKVWVDDVDCEFTIPMGAYKVQRRPIARFHHFLAISNCRLLRTIVE